MFPEDPAKRLCFPNISVESCHTFSLIFSSSASQPCGFQSPPSPRPLSNLVVNQALTSPGPGHSTVPVLSTFHALPLFTVSYFSARLIFPDMLPGQGPVFVPGAPAALSLWHVAQGAYMGGSGRAMLVASLLPEPGLGFQM